MNNKTSSIIDLRKASSKDKYNSNKMNQSIPSNIEINNFHLNTNMVNFNSNECLFNTNTNANTNTNTNQHKRALSKDKKSHTYSLQQIITKSLFNDCATQPNANDKNKNTNKNRNNNANFNKTLIDDLRKQLNEINNTQPNESKEEAGFSDLNSNAKQYYNKTKKPISIKTNSLFIKKNKNKRDNSKADQSSTSVGKINKPKLNESTYGSQLDLKSKTILRTHNYSRSPCKEKKEDNKLHYVIYTLQNVILIQQQYIEKIGLQYKFVIEELKERTRVKMKQLNEINNSLKKILLKVYDTIKTYSNSAIKEDMNMSVVVSQLITENQYLRNVIFPPCLTERIAFESNSLFAPMPTMSSEGIEDMQQFAIKSKDDNNKLQLTGNVSNSIVYLKGNGIQKSVKEIKTLKNESVSNKNKNKIRYRNNFRK